MPGAVRWRTKAWAVILERVAGGESVRSICRDPEMPAQSAVYYKLDQDSEAQEQF